MDFEIDSRIAASCVWLVDWPLSSLYLKKEANFRWIIMFPRKDNVREIYQLSQADRLILMEEIAMVSTVMENYFKPDKLNVGALGNIVPQLHIHVVARFKDDVAWPHSIWQADLPSSAYSENALDELVLSLREKLLVSVR